MRVRLRSRLREEDGYTMIAVIGAISLVSMLAAATLAATNGDINLVQFDLNHRRAHAAAQAGIADYSFHLNNDNSYWSRCANVPGKDEPGKSAVNQVGSTTKRRPVPGPSGEEYAIELLPATGQKECNSAKPVESMLEQSGLRTGSFRIRSTGYAGDAKASIVATYKRASLLDYVYFTRYETSDPVTYGDENTIKGAYKQCEKFRREGRESQIIPGSINKEFPKGQHCDAIVFANPDNIKGPVHTNDDLAICGTPKLGRGPADVIEVGSPPKGWMDAGCSGYGTANPTFAGPFVTTAPVLNPPATNGSLEKIAGAEYTFSCQTRIELNGTKMDITTNKKGTVKSVPFPASGVIYIKNALTDATCPDLKEGKKTKPWPECSLSFSPFKATYTTYPEGSDCGTAVVSGNYSGELTIAAENNIIIRENVTRNAGTPGLLGLIANNFVRVWHPYPNQTGKDLNVPGDQCGSSSGSGKLENVKIEAAILAIEHSFIVDHYDCGGSAGTLNLKGAISQKYRGAVGTTGGTGYTKNYEYDDRLRYMEPPNFLNPVEPAWHIQRETLDYP